MVKINWIVNEKELDETLPKVKDPYTRLKLCQSSAGVADVLDNKIYIKPGILLADYSK